MKRRLFLFCFLSVILLVLVLKNKDGSQKLEAEWRPLQPEAVEASAEFTSSVVEPTTRRDDGETAPLSEETVIKAAVVPPPQIHPDRHFSQPMRHLVRGIENGTPVSVQYGGAERQYVFRPIQITTENFRISSGAKQQLPSSFRVFEGRRIVEGGRLTESATLAVVNDALSMALETSEGAVLIEQNKQGVLMAKLLFSNNPENPIGHVQCITEDGLAGMNALNDLKPLEKIAGVSVVEATGTPPIEGAWTDHNFYRNGPEYDESLKDIIVLMVSGSTQTAETSLSSGAATYFTYAARSADTYENQLGLRYLLQELVLLSSTTNDIEVSSSDSETQLNAVSNWAATHRPKSTYNWGHVAGWTHVSSEGGDTIGWSWIGGPPWSTYGNATYGVSVQEREFQWGVHSHELGHNIGSNHTIYGVMNSIVTNSSQDFFRENNSRSEADPRPLGGVTGAMDVYGYITKPASDVYGDAPLRHPEEMPFAVDDNVSTPADTPVVFNPLTNDQESVMFGQTNTQLTLVEAGSVYPPNAGSVSVSENELTFTPETGFTGVAWFRYTMRGNIGNSGAGWLHAADVTVTVGGDSTSPTLTPTIQLADDYVLSDFSAPVRLNPLLNDFGEGRLWVGDVDALDGVSGPAQSYSDQAFYLVSATVVNGNGTRSYETRPLNNDGSPGTGYTGYVVYEPGASEPAVVEIQYTVEDANGVQATASIWIQKLVTVGLSASEMLLSEVDGRVLDVVVSRSDAPDVSASETVTFTLSGDVDTGGAAADIAISGHTDFDVASGTGTVVIPAGQTEATLKLSAFSDGVLEGVEDFQIEVVSSETLEVPSQGLSLQVTDDSIATGDLVPIYIEDFDQFAEPSGIGQSNNWSNPTSGDNLDWEVQSGSTPTAGTGPSGDNTSGTGKYVYFEADNGNNNNVAYLESPVYDLSGESEGLMEIAYLMYGIDLRDLRFDLRLNGGSWISDVVPVLSGQQSVNGTDWKVQQIDLTAYLPGTVQFRFRARRGNKSKGDIALDDFQLSLPGEVSPEAPGIEGQPLSQTLDVGDPLYLSVVARSYPAATYQWIKDGSPLPGETRPVFTLASVGASNAGTYSCDVTSGSTVTTVDAIVTLANADTDNDGMSDADELLAGSDPNDVNSTFSLIVATPVAGGTVAFESPTASGSHYRVYTRDSLTTGDWQVLAGYSDRTGDGNPLLIEDTPSGTRFYKIEVQASAW